MTKARDIASAAPAPAGVTSTELGYVDGVTSAIQTQVDAKAVYPSQTGNSGKYLTTNGTNTSWGTVSTGSMTLLSTTTLNAGTTTITSISGSYKKLIAIINALSLSTDQGSVLMRFNSDTGSNYDLSSWDGSGNFVSDTSITIMGNVDAPTSVNGMEITIPDYANTNSYKYCYFIGAGIRGVDVPARYQATGHWASTSAISSISFIASSGTIDAGTIYLYGVN
jgi:hypothetical protein